MRASAVIHEAIGKLASARTKTHTPVHAIQSHIDELITRGSELSKTDTNSARRLLVEAEHRARSADYFEGLASSLRRLAWLDFCAGRLDIALRRASEATFLTNPHKQVDWPNVFGATFVVNGIYRQIGKFDEAEAGWHKLLNLSELHSDSLRRADALDELGRLRIAQGRHEEALNLRHAALTIYQATNDPFALMVLNNIADTQLLLNQYSAAYLTASSTLKQCPPDRPDLRATLMHTMGLAQLRRGLQDEAEKLFEEGAKIAALPGQERSLVVSYMIGKGMLACAKSLFTTGTIALKKALSHAERWQLVTSQVDALEALTKAYQQAGDARMAHHYAAQHAALVQKLGIERNKLQVRVTKVEPVVADLRAQWLTKLRFA